MRLFKKNYVFDKETDKTIKNCKNYYHSDYCEDYMESVFNSVVDFFALRSWITMRAVAVNKLKHFLDLEEHNHLIIKANDLLHFENWNECNRVAFLKFYEENKYLYKCTARNLISRELTYPAAGRNKEALNHYTRVQNDKLTPQYLTLLIKRNKANEEVD